MEKLEEYVPVGEQTMNAWEQIEENKEKAGRSGRECASEILVGGNEKVGQGAAGVKSRRE